jgi:hypothetical protein
MRMISMKITKKHIGKYVKREDWFYPVMVTYVENKQFVYKNAYGMIFVDECEGNWMIDYDDRWWRSK